MTKCQKSKSLAAAWCYAACMAMSLSLAGAWSYMALGRGCLWLQVSQSLKPAVCIACIVVVYACECLLRMCAYVIMPSAGGWPGAPLFSQDFTNTAPKVHESSYVWPELCYWVYSDQNVLKLRKSNIVRRYVYHPNLNTYSSVVMFPPSLLGFGRWYISLPGKLAYLATYSQYAYPYLHGWYYVVPINIICLS